MEIGHGAEALVLLKRDLVIKKRVKKGYRNEELDRKIRRERNKKEVRLLQKIRGIRVPRVDSVDEFEFVMEYIKGDKLKDISLEGLSKKIGEVVGTLHEQNIYHGDLTTSNMILCDNEVVLIDFGLSDRGKIEDFATDLKVLFEVADATHKDFLRNEFFKGYKKNMKKTEGVKKRLKKVYSRGRYIKPNSK